MVSPKSGACVCVCVRAHACMCTMLQRYEILNLSPSSFSPTISLGVLHFGNRVYCYLMGRSALLWEFIEGGRTCSTCWGFCIGVTRRLVTTSLSFQCKVLVSNPYSLDIQTHLRSHKSASISPFSFALMLLLLSP